MNLPDPRVLHNTYQISKPFPNIVLKNTFDENLLFDASDEFDFVKDWKVADHDHVKNKHSLSRYDELPESCKKVVDLMNGERFTEWLSKLTGYRNLISDPYIGGGGLHMTTNGGFLDVHRDFNYSKKLKANRKINAIVFLTPGYCDWWHGELELWSEDKVGKRVPARFGDLAIFNTDQNYHGHPTPLKFPNDEKRKSIALYYYQVGKPESEPHSTIYKRTK